MGLTEAICPIIYDDKILGYLIMGKILSNLPTKELWQKVYDQCKQYDVDFEALEKAFYNLPYLEMDKINAAAYILDMSSKYIYLSNIAKIQESTVIRNIKNYIESQFDKDISLSTMCEYLNLSKSYICSIMKSQINMTFTQYLLNTRISKARLLLEKTNSKIHEISTITGFTDQNYFSRIFKRLVGVTATEYRTLQR